MGERANRKLHARQAERERRRTLVKGEHEGFVYYRDFNRPAPRVGALQFSEVRVSTKRGVLEAIHSIIPHIRVELVQGTGIVVVAIIQLNMGSSVWKALGGDADLHSRIRRVLHDSLPAGVVSYIFDGPVWRWSLKVIAKLDGTYAIGFVPTDDGAFTILTTASEEALLALWGHLERRMQWLAANLTPRKGKRKRKLYELWMRRVTDELTRRSRA